MSFGQKTCKENHSTRAQSEERYMPGPNGFDSIIVGYYRGDDLTYVARARKALFGRRGASLEKKKKVNCAILAGPAN